MPTLEQVWQNHAAPLGAALADCPKWAIQLGCFCLTLLVLWADYALGRQISLALFYCIPVSIMAWFVNPIRAFLLAVFGVVVWVMADSPLGAVFTPWIPLFNGLFRVLFYAFFIAVVVRVKHLQDTLKARAEERARALAQQAARNVLLEHDMLEAAAHEQRRIGQDLHDGLCQHLTGTALAGQVLVENLAGGSGVQRQARKIVELIEDGIALARGIAKGLYPIELESDGLMHALQDFTTNTSVLFGVDCRFECQLPVLVENPSTAAHLYRIAQEAVSNALRHGRATAIEVSLEESDSGVRLSVADNGTGLPSPLPLHDGLGLRTMADRARSMGGKFYIHAGALGGAEVICVAPGGWIT
jgi:signal transduction histidine kinase